MGFGSSGKYTHGRTGQTSCPSTQTWADFKAIQYNPEAVVCQLTIN